MMTFYCQYAGKFFRGIAKAKSEQKVKRKIIFDFRRAFVYNKISQG